MQIHAFNRASYSASTALRPAFRQDGQGEGDSLKIRFGNQQDRLGEAQSGGDTVAVQVPQSISEPVRQESVPAEVGRPQSARPDSNWSDAEIDAFLVRNQDKYDPRVGPVNMEKFFQTTQEVMTEHLAPESEGPKKMDLTEKPKEKPKPISDSILKMFSALYPLLKVMSNRQAALNRAESLLPTESTWRVFKYKWSLTRWVDRFSHVAWGDMMGAVLRLQLGKAKQAWQEGKYYVARKIVSLQGASRVKAAQSRVMALKEQKPFIEDHREQLSNLIANPEIPWSARQFYRLERYILCDRPLKLFKTYGPLLDRVPHFSLRDAEIQAALQPLIHEYEGKTGRKIRKIESEPIGSGSIAQVFKAEDDHGRELAIKLLRPDAKASVVDQLTDYNYFMNVIETGWDNRVDAYRSALKKTELLKAELRLSREKEIADRLRDFIGYLNRLNPANPVNLKIPVFYASSERGNIQEFISTAPLSQDQNKEILYRNLLTIGPAFLRILALSSVVPLDPHHGNFTHADEAKGIPPSALDHGRSVAVNPSEFEDFNRLRLSLLAMDGVSRGYRMDCQFGIQFNQEQRQALRELLVEPANVTDEQLDALLNRMTSELSAEKVTQANGNLFAGVMASSGVQEQIHHKTNLFNFWLQYTDVMEALRLEDPKGPQLKPLFNLVVSPEDKLQVMDKTLGLLKPAFIVEKPEDSDEKLMALLQDFSAARKRLFNFDADPVFKWDLRDYFSRHFNVSTLENGFIKALETSNEAGYREVIDQLPQMASAKREQFLKLCRAHLRVVELADLLAQDMAALYPALMETKKEPVTGTGQFKDRPVSPATVKRILSEQIRDYVELSPDRLFKHDAELTQRNVFSWLSNSFV